MIVVRLKGERGNWIEMGRTEMINDNLNPKFVKSVVVPYHFEEEQRLSIEVYDVDDFSEKANLAKHDFVGKLELLLHDIVGAPGQHLEKPLQNQKSRRKNNGILFISATEKDHKLDTQFRIRVEARNLKPNGFLFFYLVRKMPKDNRRVYKSQIQKRSDHQDYIWNIFVIEASTLALYDFDHQLALEVWKSQKSGKHIFIGSMDFTIRQMQEKNEERSRFQLYDKNRSQCGSILLNTLQVAARYSFLDYVIGGCEISLLIGLDFTLSNKKPRDPSSLHCYDFTRNEYIQAIESVGQIIQCYDSDKKIPVFGFGAKVPGMNKVSHCFALNGNIFDPELDQIEGVLECYKNNIERLEFYGPTHFSHILKMAVDFADYQKVTQYNQKYFILLMITDGKINDMQKTIDQIVRGSSLPLSIIIVGVGAADFNNMDVQVNYKDSLDADDTPLYSQTLKKHMERDIVQFVPFRKFKDDPHRLARQTLEEVPRQLLSYFQSESIYPMDKRVGLVLENEQDIPSYFIQRKLQFAQFLHTKMKLDPAKVEALLNKGIPSEDPEYVLSSFNNENGNPLLQKSHFQRSLMNEHHYRMKSSNHSFSSRYAMSEENIKLSFDQEPVNEERDKNKFFYAYQGRKP